jgi:hypothetical protein
LGTKRIFQSKGVTGSIKEELERMMKRWQKVEDARRQKSYYYKQFPKNSKEQEVTKKDGPQV